MGLLEVKRHDFDKQICQINLLKRIIYDISKFKFEQASLNRTFYGLVSLERARLYLLINKINQEKYVQHPEKIEALARQAAKIYDKILKIDRDSEVRFKSRTLIQFWLYYAARYAKMEAHADRHLDAAHNSLQSDPTVPTDSVLNTMVIRMSAYKLWAEADKESRKLASSGLASKTLYAFAIKQFATALQYTIQIDGKQRNRIDLIYCESDRDNIINTNNKVMYASDLYIWSRSKSRLSTAGYSFAKWEDDHAELERVLRDDKQLENSFAKHTIAIYNYARENYEIALEMFRELVGGELPPRWILNETTSRIEFDYIRAQRAVSAIKAKRHHDK